MTETKSLKNQRKKFQQQGVFYTPLYFCEQMKAELKKPYSSVLDPLCGQGNLLSVLDDEVKKYGVELDLLEAEKANRLPNADIIAGDFFEHIDEIPLVDAILMNPPYSVKWEGEKFQNHPAFKDVVLPLNSKADYAFLLMSLERLKAGGECVALMMPGILYRSGREQKIREYLVRRGWIKKIINYPAKAFEDTSIATVLLVLEKTSREKGSILFCDGENEQKASFEEIEKQNFCLSPSTYIPVETKKETIDIDAHQLEDRTLIKTNLENSLSFHKFSLGVFSCEEEKKQAFNSYLEELKAICDKMKF